MMKRNLIRQQNRQLRRAISGKAQHKASLNILNNLISLSQVKSARNIATYLANDGEINLDLFNKWCWQNNINTFLPVLHPFCKGHLLFLSYNKNSIMVQNKYGIWEPKLSLTAVLPANQLDAIITPLVAFDEQGNRIGMGGGYYDRTLAPLNGHLHKAPITIGTAHDLQKTPEIPYEDWDIPLNMIVTDQRYY